MVRFFFPILFFSFHLSAQSGLQKAEDYQQQAFEYLYEEKTDSADWFRRKAAGIFKDSFDLPGYLRFHSYYNYYCRLHGLYEHSRNVSEEVLGSPWKEASTVEEFQGISSLLSSAGYAYKKLNQIEKAAFFYQKAADLYQEGGPLPKNEAYAAQYIYSELGNAYNRLRDYEKAGAQLRFVPLFLKVEDDRIPSARQDCST